MRNHYYSSRIVTYTLYAYTQNTHNTHHFRIHTEWTIFYELGSLLYYPFRRQCTDAAVPFAGRFCLLSLKGIGIVCLFRFVLFSSAEIYLSSIRYLLFYFSDSLDTPPHTHTHHFYFLKSNAPKFAIRRFIEWSMAKYNRIHHK